MIYIRQINIDDFNEIVKIHKDVFADHFLGQYSANLIKRYYLQFFEKTTFLIIEENEKICGFILGGHEKTLDSCKQAFIDSNKCMYLLESIYRPQIYVKGIKKFFEYFIKNKNTQKPSQYSYRLLSMGISKNQQKKGFGKKLLNCFEKISLANTKIYGVSCMRDNRVASNFYIKNGFNLEKKCSKSLYFYKKI